MRQSVEGDGERDRIAARLQQALPIARCDFSKAIPAKAISTNRRKELTSLPKLKTSKLKKNATRKKLKNLVGDERHDFYSKICWIASLEFVN